MAAAASVRLVQSMPAGCCASEAQSETLACRGMTFIEALRQKGKSLGIGASDKTVALAFSQHSKLPDGGRLLDPRL